MATSSAPAEPSSDPLSRLRISRPDAKSQPPRGGGWIRWLVVIVVLLGAIGGGGALAIKQGWISVGKDWLAVPEMIQSRPEVRLATVTVETGRSAEALVVATGYLESRRQARI